MSILFAGGDAPHHHDNVSQLVAKCAEDGLELNVAKTNELIVGVRKCAKVYDSVIINGSDVPIVPHHPDYLVTTLSADLSWSDNIQLILKRAMGRMYTSRVQGLPLSSNKFLHQHHPERNDNRRGSMGRESH